MGKIWAVHDNKTKQHKEKRAEKKRERGRENVQLFIRLYVHFLAACPLVN